MGIGNTVVKQWLKRKERFADLFNGQIFDGRQVICAEDLEPVDSEADILLTDKSGKKRELQRYRDIVMQWKKGPLLVVLACENQAKIHYAMPVRSMLYDGLSYIEQMRQIWETHKDEKLNMTSDEFLSKFLKGDKIYPVITLVLYYGTEKWDASTELYEMFPKELPLETLESYVPNYRINFVEAGNINKLEKFHTDLQQIFGMLQYRNSKTELISYMQKNGSYFRNVDEETYEVIREFLHSERILKKEVGRKKEEKIDMCQALEELYADGIEKGKQLGIQAGSNQKLMELVAKKLNKGKSVEEIADALEESVEVIEEIIKKVQG